MLALARWRDVGLLLLALEIFVIGLPIGAALYYGLRGLRRAHAWLLPRLQIARGYARQSRDVATQVMAGASVPFVTAQSAVAGLRQALQLLRRR